MAAGSNNKAGTVVEATSPAIVRPGVVFVLLDGDARPTMLKVSNLRT